MLYILHFTHYTLYFLSLLFFRQFTNQLFDIFLTFPTALSGFGHLLNFLIGQSSIFHRICHIAFCNTITRTYHLISIHITVPVTVRNRLFLPAHYPAYTDSLDHHQTAHIFLPDYLHWSLLHPVLLQTNLKTAWYGNLSQNKPHHK